MSLPVEHTTSAEEATLARGLLAEIASLITRGSDDPWRLMEVCGGQTHSILRNGLDQLLPPGIELIHGPGCPVCVTPLELIDRAIALARRPGVTLCSFGDMVRVPGSETDLARVRSEGGDVRIVYSPLDAVDVAESEPGREVVFFAVGFETTAPANAMAVRRASDAGLANFSVLVSHVLVPPAIEAIASAPDSSIDAFLAAGHVCTIMGTEEYKPLAAAYGVPIVVTGFDPLDVLEGVRRAVVQLESGRAEVDNAYERIARPDGNAPARALLSEVFDTVDRNWRGIGMIPASGWRLSEPYATFDAERRFGVDAISAPEPDVCRAGDVLTGKIRPHQCPAFDAECTPRTPLGAPMVSSEGACAAYHRYRSVELTER